MFWQEDPQTGDSTVTEEVVDLSFGMVCRCLPVDHAYALSQAVQALLPWFSAEPGAGLHAIFVAASQNGWVRPDHAGALLYPSRRTKFKLRLPKHRLDEARVLEGRWLDVAGHAIQLTTGEVRPLSAHTTIFTRHLVSEGYADETQLLTDVAREMNELGVKPKKMLLGTETLIATPDRVIKTRSLMVADLTIDEALSMQKQGLGAHQWLGCGIFIPHKDIHEVRDESMR